MSDSDQGQCIINAEEIFECKNLLPLLEERGAPLIDGEFDPAYLVEMFKDDEGNYYYRWGKI